MKIVLVDAHTANPGDLSWSDFEDLGAVSVYPRSTEDEIIERCQGADVILTNKAPITAKIIDALADLKYIGVTATGYNIIDLDAARARNIAVTNVPGYGSESVAQMCIALILELSTNVGLHAEAVNNGEWHHAADFCFWKKPLFDLAGKTIGLIGFGAIAQAVCRIALAFNMNVIAHTRSPKQHPDVSFVSLEQLLQNADIVSLHCPLTDETNQLINNERLALMQKHALLINTSRGQLIDEAALAKALYDGEIQGAGLDVLSSEPPSTENPLIMAPNCIITPHIAWATREARQRLIGTACTNIEAYLAGKETNRVDK